MRDPRTLACRAHDHAAIVRDVVGIAPVVVNFNRSTINPSTGVHTYRAPFPATERSAPGRSGVDGVDHSIVAPAGGSATMAAPTASHRTSTRRPGKSAHPMAALPSVEVNPLLVTPTAPRGRRSADPANGRSRGVNAIAMTATGATSRRPTRVAASC